MEIIDFCTVSTKQQEEAMRQDRKRRQALQEEERKKELENERIEKGKEASILVSISEWFNVTM